MIPVLLVVVNVSKLDGRANFQELFAKRLCLVKFNSLQLGLGEEDGRQEGEHKEGESHDDGQSKESLQQSADWALVPFIGS